MPGREFVVSKEPEVVQQRSRVSHFDCDCIDHPVPLVEVLEGVDHELFLELLHLRVLSQFKVLKVRNRDLSALIDVLLL